MLRRKSTEEMIEMFGTGTSSFRNKLSNKQFLEIDPFTCAGLRHAWICLLRAQVLTDHLLERAHEHRNESVDVTGIVAAGRLQNHQGP